MARKSDGSRKSKALESKAAKALKKPKPKATPTQKPKPKPKPKAKPKPEPKPKPKATPKPKAKPKPKPKPKSAGYHHGDLRTALLDAALEAIAEGGVVGLSLRDCARRVGVSHAAPYRHFPDKDALLAAIAEQGFGVLVEQAEAAMVAHTEPRARLDSYGVAYVRFAISHPAHHRVMFTGPIDGPKDPSESPNGGRAFDLLVEAAAPLVAPGDDPVAAAFAFWSLVHGISMLVLDGRVPEEHLADINALVRNSFAFWRAQPPST